jgi:hypothetical protein
MLTCGKLDHCANSKCLAIFLTPSKYESLMSFCPLCRQAIKDEVEALDHLLEDAEDDGSSN